MLEREASGGQAGSGARIENYPGFPEGISGLELTGRTYDQARRFGAEFVLVNEVTAADPNARGPFHLGLLDGTELRSHAVLLDAPHVPEFIGRGICDGSRITEALLYRGTRMCSSSGVATRRARPRCIWPGMRSASPCSSEPTRSPAACRST